MSYTLNQKILLSLRKVYSFFMRKKDQYPLQVNDPDVASKLISDKILSGEPLMVSRFGAVEIGCVANYLGIKSINHRPLSFIRGETPEWWWNEGIRYCMKNNAGFFPNDDDNLKKFSELILEDIKIIDVLLSWQSKEVLFKDYLKKSVSVGFIWIDPFWSKVPWTQYLKGKSVLVVHPFSDEIDDQYSHNREYIHNNRQILPEFKLITLKAVQSIGGTEKFSTWFDALDYMKQQIDGIDFDIALIGCGAYGMPLAAHIKRSGKQAIHSDVSHLFPLIPNNN